MSECLGPPGMVMDFVVRARALMNFPNPPYDGASWRLIAERTGMSECRRVAFRLSAVVYAREQYQKAFSRNPGEVFPGKLSFPDQRSSRKLFPNIYRE